MTFSCIFTAVCHDVDPTSCKMIINTNPHACYTSCLQQQCPRSCGSCGKINVLLGYVAHVCNESKKKIQFPFLFQCICFLESVLTINETCNISDFFFME